MKAVLYAVQDVVLMVANVVRDNSSICAIVAGFLAFAYLVGR